MRQGGDRIYWHDAECSHFLPKVAYQRVSIFAREAGHCFGVKEDALRRSGVEQTYVSL